jgi:hypothetical protein
MGLKIRALSIFVALAVSMLCSLGFFGTISAESAESDLQDVSIYMHGDPGNGTLNTSYGYYEEQHVLTTSSSDWPSPNSIFIGEWVTKPISSPMNIQGTLLFAVYARGNLEGVRFTAYLSVNGVEVSNQMITARQDLNDTFPVEFIGEPINTTQPLELNTSDVIGLRLSLDHLDERYPPIISGGKNVTLVLSYGFGSFVRFPTNSMQITEINGRDDPTSGNMIVTATIKCSFGNDDFNYATARSDHGSLTLLSETFLDNGTVEVEWEWDYTVSEGGSYVVTIKAKDMNYNTWQEDEDIHITTPNTEIDFSISSSDITFSNDPKKNVNTTISAKIRGSGKRWNSYQVEIEFYDDSTLIEKVKGKISRGGTNEVTLLWTPDSGGTHNLKVIIDPDDDFSETVESNNEATKKVEINDGSGGGATPGFESLWLIAAMGIVLFLGMLSRRKG